MLYSCWFALLLALLYSTVDTYSGRLTVVIDGREQDPNELIGYFMYAVITYYSAFLTQKKKSVLLMLCLYIFTILQTGSRGGLLGILAGIMIYTLIWMKEKKTSASVYLRLILAVLILVTFFRLTLGYIPEEVAQRFSIDFTLRDRGAGRRNIWQSLITSYSSFPLFNQLLGMGTGTVKYFTISGAVGHNIWLDALVETGLIGVIVLFIMYFEYGKAMYKLKEYVILSCFIGYMTMAITLSLYSYKPIWNIMLMALIMKRCAKSPPLVHPRCTKDGDSKLLNTTLKAF
jgi:O-antigen ligase